MKYLTILRKLTVATLLFAQPLLLVAQKNSRVFFFEDPRISFLTRQRVYRPVATIKTNLLYNMALTPNVGVEVPIGERWSVGADFMRGWWLKRDWSFCWQVQSAGVEGRFWLSDRTGLRRQGGWFIGAFVLAGFYDFQLKSARGVQGEHTVVPGLSGGYVHPLYKGWGLELTLGAGYLTNSYRRYTVEDTHDGHELVRLGAPMRFVGVVPCKVGVSLQWTFSKARYRGGSR
ncbi:MAG: DUF3575 domain-containing protein [Prevotellaceae bacterium]|jgi:hypothetical protein|nr:DUF3575 domain-containing protein [Prevotellaceae bacterium]